MKKAFEILSDPLFWTTGLMFEIRQDDEMNPVRCFCALGAIREKHELNPRGHDSTPEYVADVKKLAYDVSPEDYRASVDLLDYETTVTSWNDVIARDWSEVHSTLKRLDI